MGPGSKDANPLQRGAWSAVSAALLFGAATPFVQRFGSDVGPFLTASLLYLGATLGSYNRSGAASDEAPVRSEHRLRVLAIAVLGAVLAPASLAWGLQHTGATSASLLLNFEAVFTLLLSSMIHRESIGRRVAVAVVLMGIGGSMLLGGAPDHSPATVWGMAAVLGATIAWAADNTLMLPLASLDPRQVVRWKSAIGCVLSLAIGVLRGELLGSASAIFGLIACGLIGYGLSLQFYLRAQRAIGAARTGSVFAMAPFIGAVLGWVLGDRHAGSMTFVAACFFGLALYLHLTEHHEHEHTHDELEHEHAHSHEDGHHDHTHDPPAPGKHSHPHRHDTRIHAHAHGPDTHHRHSS